MSDCPASLPLRAAGRPGAPAVCFLHGFMGAGADWQPATDALAGPFRTLAVDLPGQGTATGLPEACYTMPGAAAAVLRTLDAAGYGAGGQAERVAVVGYSMGGRLALHLALHHPDRLAALVLVSASPGLADAAARAARRRTDAARAAALRDDLPAFLHAWYRQPLFASLAHHGLAAPMTARRAANDPRELGRVLRGMGTGAQTPLWDRLPALAVPTLALAGALDAKYVALAEQMAAYAPRLAAAVVPDAGHALHAERPAAFLAHLRPFLARHLTDAGDVRRGTANA